ncbi:hypothetical protein JOE61_003849 [Nocardioides salarius]|uniref:N-acetylmuramoyl-L-alanine amidase domain-containing protein n=1 Tax=Nocardioides salarius TaxID=374513 RepID=A0ABS2MFS1_9ACTN|nr:N-acetylmuramoyl-L-alanine amidase [Nocardioides salarius]MBM7510035.1 hypothetical protein [Nocardioides salarius]
MPSTDRTEATQPVDLPDELAMTDLEARSWLDVKPTAFNPDLARLTGFAADYSMCTWLADVLRAAGCDVVEYPGWKTRGRPRSTGPWDPQGVMWHHDASAPGPSPALAAFLAEIGRPSEGIPAPLSQLWVCLGCGGKHPVGTWHVLAAGRANHAGYGDGWGAIGDDSGNAEAIGVETDNTTGEDTPEAMYESLVRGTAAILRHLRAKPTNALCAHKEYAPGRKTDPDDIDMDEARADVSAQLRRALVPWPGADHFGLHHQCKDGHVKRLEGWLLSLPANRKSTHEARDTVTKWTLDRVKAFQRDRPGKVESGRMNPLTWRQIQRAARSRR